MKIFVAVLCLMIVLMPLGQVAFAVTNDFSIRALIGNDTTAPTTPATISVAPVAPTQINITWSASTDDVQLAGYRLFRDAVQIATTTLLSFSDTGLTPSTTYSYYVDAYDIFGNYSSSSPTVATTTPPLPPPVATSTPATATTQNDATRVLTIQNLIVTPDETSALFLWQTNTQTQYSLNWGRTTAYELGSVSGTVFNQNHSTVIDMLEPGTLYYYQLSAIDSRGRSRVIATDTFTTLNKIFTNNIPNVDGFKAVAQDTDVKLSWRNTFNDPNFLVRIVRSHLFYPTNMQSGAVVYEGRGQAFTDSAALASRSPQYYTIFVIGSGGKVSSGAIARVYKANSNSAVEAEGETPGAQIVPGTEVIPPTVIDEGDPAILQVRDVTISQSDAVFSLDTVISLDYQLPFVIQIPYTAVAPHLKTITVSIVNPSNQHEVSAYLLKLNPAGNAYEALIAQQNVVGSSRILIEVFDYEKQTVRRISTTVQFVSTSLPVPFFPDQIVNYVTMIIPFILVLLVGWILLVIIKQREKK